MAGEDVLQRIVDLINNVEEAVTTPQLNESLSRYLSERLLATREFLQTEAVQNFKERISKPLKELHRIVSEAHSNVQECCSNAWIPAAIQQAGNEEAFFEVLKDLHWCTGVVKTAIRKTIAESGDAISDPESPLFVEHTPTADAEAVEKAIRSEVDKAAKSDHDALISRLNGITDSQTDQAGLSTDDVALAKHLKSWIASGDTISRDLRIKQGTFIGKGMSGPVFRSTWQGQTVAEKLFSPGDDKARKAFVQEAEVMRKRRHPNVVKLVARDDAKWKLVLELMDGSLTGLILEQTQIRDNLQGESTQRNRAPFPLPVTVDILLQISKGMLFLHKHRVAHRDIKSGNILYNRPREPGGYVRVKVADFGLATVKDNSLIAMTADLGTLHWTAPEMFWKRKGQIVKSKQGEKHYVTTTHPLRADVYSFAITCFEVLSGETNPYGPPGTVTQLAYKVAEEGLRPALPEDLPPALAYLLRACWAKNLSERPKFDYIYKFLLDFKASLLTDSPFSYTPWINSGTKDTSRNPENEPELLVGPKFSATAWVIGAVSWLFSSTRFKSLEEITYWDMRSRQMTYEMLEAPTMGSGELNIMRQVRLSRGVEAMVAKTSAQSEEVFLKRAFFLTQLEAHPNLPKIIGYKVQNDDFYLVHKADSVKVVGSLHDVMSLSADSDWSVRQDLTWEQRYNIALGVGQALVLLHELSTPIIHGSLSSRNIMLEEDNYNPRLFNFYTSFMLPRPGVHSNFPSNDTRGWDAPEKDAIHGHKIAFEQEEELQPLCEADIMNQESDPSDLAFKQDVFSFGVLLLVLVTGKNAFTATNMRQHVHIANEAWKYFNEDRQSLMELVGPGVNGQSDVVFRVLKLALHCVHEEAHRRPKISEAVDMLLGKTELKVLRRSSLKPPVPVKDQEEPSSSSAITSGRNASDVSEKMARAW